MGVKHVGSASSKPRHADSAGMPPERYRGGPWDDETGLKSPADREAFVVPAGPGSGGKRATPTNGKSRFNLRAVVEVLEEFGLDPVAEIARTLQETKPVLDKKTGEQLVIKGKKQTTPALDIDTRARLLMGLTEYVHPKLKSVEMTVKTPELSDEQVDARLAALLLKQQQAEAKKS